MNRIVRIIAASTLTFGLLLCGTFAFAQKSPAFEAKFKIAEGADLRILGRQHLGLQQGHHSSEMEGNRRGSA